MRAIVTCGASRSLHRTVNCCAIVVVEARRNTAVGVRAVLVAVGAREPATVGADEKSKVNVGEPLRILRKIFFVGRDSTVAQIDLLLAVVQQVGQAVLEVATIAFDPLGRIAVAAGAEDASSQLGFRLAVRKADRTLVEVLLLVSQPIWTALIVTSVVDDACKGIGSHQVSSQVVFGVAYSAAVLPNMIQTHEV